MVLPRALPFVWPPGMTLVTVPGVRLISHVQRRGRCSVRSGTCHLRLLGGDRDRRGKDASTSQWTRRTSQQGDAWVRGAPAQGSWAGVCSRSFPGENLGGRGCSCCTPFPVITLERGASHGTPWALFPRPLHVLTAQPTPSAAHGPRQRPAVTLAKCEPSRPSLPRCRGFVAICSL